MVQEGLCFSAPLNLIFSIVRLKIYQGPLEFVSSRECKTHINITELENIAWKKYYGHLNMLMMQAELVMLFEELVM